MPSPIFHKLRRLMVLIVLLAYSAQSMGLLLVKQSDGAHLTAVDKPNCHEMMSAMSDHNSPNNEELFIKTVSYMDCCGDDCPMLGCHISGVFPSSFDTLSFSDVNKPFSHLSLMSLHKRPNSLYRPPNFS